MLKKTYKVESYHDSYFDYSIKKQILMLCIKNNDIDTLCYIFENTSDGEKNKEFVIDYLIYFGLRMKNNSKMLKWSFAKYNLKNDDFNLNDELSDYKYTKIVKYCT